MRIVKVRARVIYEGRVQGVFFRSNTKRYADTMGLTGWVRNLPNGNVEAVFEGEEENVRSAIDWHSERHSPAKVESKTVEILGATGEFVDFSIMYD